MAENTLFSRLQKLFSTDVVIRNKGGDQLKVIDVNTIQRIGKTTNQYIDRYNRIYARNTTSLYGQQLNLNYKYIRPRLYSEYDLMDTDAIIASALDIIAEECTLKNEMGDVLRINSSNDDIKKVLYNLHYDILNIEFNLWSWIRQMCKYGDFFLKLQISDKFGIYNIVPYSAYYIERIETEEDKDGNPHLDVKFLYHPEGVLSPNDTINYNVESTQNKPTWENYEIAHFRLTTDINYAPYGRSFIEPARKLYKQYTMMEEAMLIHRIVRSADKRIFYINVGSIPPTEVETFMQKIVNNMKRSPHINPETGEYNLRYNLQNLLEDYYIPVRGGDATTKVDNVPGLNYTGIDDVAYLREKLFAALKIPKAFLGYEKDIEGKSTLAAQDIRFARTIDRIQRIVLSELYKISLIHLYTQGFRGEDLTNFELNLTSPSIIFEQEKISLLKEKVELATSIINENLLPSEWVYSNIFNLSEKEYDEYRDLALEDAKRKFRINQIENEGNDPYITGKSYGTPHDLATLYGKGRMDSNPNNLPDGYNTDIKLGRKKERVSNINTQQNPLGKDRLGIDGMKYDDNESDSIKPQYKGGNVLALENYINDRNSSMEKTLIVENKDNISFLKEKNILK